MGGEGRGGDGVTGRYGGSTGQPDDGSTGGDTATTDATMDDCDDDMDDDDGDDDVAVCGSGTTGVALRARRRWRWYQRSAARAPRWLRFPLNNMFSTHVASAIAIICAALRRACVAAPHI